MKIDFDKVKVGRVFVKTDVFKANPWSNCQPKTRVEDGIAYEEMIVKVTSATDRGDYLYVGYVPTLNDFGRCQFGYTRLEKNDKHWYGTKGFEAYYNYE